MKEIAILMPVYNDWSSAFQLVSDIRKLASDPAYKLNYILVNDGSADLPPDELLQPEDVQVLDLHRNQGHQRAIAIGLCWLNDNMPQIEAVIVMDADGEDRPSGIVDLLKASETSGSKIIFAGRVKRTESLFFRMNYWLYRLLFILLTGRPISFGNFCLIPAAVMKKLVFAPEIWNHFTGGILRSKLPYTSIPIARGKRISGGSKMNFVSLVLHGLSAISVYVDVVAVRLLITFLVLSVLSAIGVLVVIYLKLFTSLAIPGWATGAASGLILICLLALLISFFLSFIALNYRSQQTIIPLKNYRDYLSNAR